MGLPAPVPHRTQTHTVVSMWGRVAASAAIAALGLGGLSGCGSTEDESPVRTRAECDDDPALSGCEYGLPLHVVERQQAAAREKAQEQRRKRQQRPPVPQGVGVEGLDDGSRYSIPDDGLIDGAPPRPNVPPPGRCWDITSFDQNWDNDVLCTDFDGSQFHTSYEGADAFLSR